MAEHILTAEKLREILATTEKQKTEDIFILERKIEPGADKGTNFSGEVAAIKITAKICDQMKKYHWFAKLPVDDPTSVAITTATQSEHKEIRFYNHMIPALKQFIADRNIELNVAPFVYSELYEDQTGNKNKKKPNILILENLITADGCYRDPVNKMNGLSLDYTKVALDEIAKLHAVSYAYAKSLPGGVSNAGENLGNLARDFIYTDPCQFLKDLQLHDQPENLAGMRNVLKVCQGPGQDLVGILNHFHELNDIFESRNACYKTDPSGFNVLCHGDPWFNNMLFQ